MRCTDCGRLLNTSYCCSVTNRWVYNCSTRGVPTINAKSGRQTGMTTDHTDHYFVVDPKDGLVRVTPVSISDDWTFVKEKAA